MYMVKYIIQKLFSSHIQLSYRDFSVHFAGNSRQLHLEQIMKKKLFFKKS